MKYVRLITLLICLLFADSNCIAQSKSSVSRFEERTISYINKAKSYISANKESIKIDTDNPVESIQVNRYDKEETIDEIVICYYNTDKVLVLMFDKSGKITKVQLMDSHPSGTTFLNKRNFRDMLSWNVVFQKYLIESIKFIKKKQIPFNYKTSVIYFSSRSEDSNKQKIKYDILFNDHTKKLILYLSFDANMKVVKYKIKKDSRSPIDMNISI